MQTVGFEDLWTRFFDSAGVRTTSSASRVHLDSSLAALALAASGPRCAMVLDSFAAPFIESGRLAVPLETDLPIGLSHYLLLPDEGNRRKPEVRLFEEWLFEEPEQTIRRTA